MTHTRPILTRVASGTAAVLLAASLAGCGALGSSGSKEGESSSPSTTTSASSGESSGSGEDETSDEASDAASPTPSADTSPSSGSEETTPAAQGEEQPAGEPDAPATWLANTPYVPLEGIDSVSVEGVHGGSPAGNTFTMSFTFDHPNASQGCKDAVAAINEVEIPIHQMSVAKYEGNFKAIDPSLAGPTIQAAAVHSNEEFNLMDKYNDILAQCGNTPGEPKAVVEKLPDHEGIHVQLGNADLIIAGKSHGNRHIWMILANVDPAQAKTYVDAQIDLFDRSVANAT